MLGHNNALLPVRCSGVAHEEVHGSRWLYRLESLKSNMQAICMTSEDARLACDDANAEKHNGS